MEKAAGSAPIVRAHKIVFICQKNLSQQLLTSTLVWVHFRWILVESGTNCWCFDWTRELKTLSITHGIREKYIASMGNQCFSENRSCFLHGTFYFSWNFIGGCFFLFISPLWYWYRMKLWLLFDWERWKWHGTKFGNTINLVFRCRFVRLYSSDGINWYGIGCLFHA